MDSGVVGRKESVHIHLQLSSLVKTALTHSVSLEAHASLPPFILNLWAENKEGTGYLPGTTHRPCLPLLASGRP